MRTLIPSLVLVASALAQPTLNLQDLSIQTVATGITHAGDIEVDAAGNVWVIQAQSLPGGTTGLLTRISPTGVVTAGLGSPLAEMGDLHRAQDGFIYFWMNTTAGQADLCQLLPGGTITTIMSAIGYQALGIEQNAAGEFLMGTKASSPNVGIYRRQSNGVLSQLHSGVPAGDNRHLLYDTQSQLHAASAGNVYTLTGSTTVVTLYQSPLFQGGSDITSLDLGYFDHLLIGRRLGVGPALFGDVSSLTPEGYVTNIAALGIILGSTRPVSCRDLTGTGIYILSAGTLYYVTGPAGMLTVGYPTQTSLQARVDHDGSSALFSLAMDAPGISLTLPPWGTFATSLGTGPSWTLLLDGLGVFRPSDGSVAPWTTTVPLPAPPLNQTVTAQAYILDPFAANGLIKITNAVTLSL